VGAAAGGLVVAAAVVAVVRVTLVTTYCKWGLCTICQRYAFPDCHCGCHDQPPAPPPLPLLPPR
jgi:hypothetical protein